METQARQDRIDELFEQTCDLPPEEREAFLNAADEGNVGLVAEVRRLLAAHDRAEASTDFLATPSTQQLAAPVVQDAHDSAPRSARQRPKPLVGQSIGPYEVREWLGGGGFGDVYLAERSDAYRQQVAIKVLRADRDDDDRLRARFELERQLQADFQHPHIARLLYGGELEEGQPYIVMEYIQGRPITKYCDEKRLPINERLALFRQVCAAVAYAHRYGAIHRDIKPGNILVDAEGQAKLLDFGIAKIVDSHEPRPGITLQRERLLTPEYASPEQVKGAAVSTASDVYSLGVLLYELLTGRRPYDLDNATDWQEVERIVCEAPPRPPSTAVLEEVRMRRTDATKDVRSAETLAEPRSTNPHTLQRLLKGDLEQIVLKALHKEQQDRYATVEVLLEDLAHYEDGRPVTARPISRCERAVRWVKRNRIVAAAATTAIIALIAGTVTSTIFAIHARREAAAALAAKTTAETVLDFVENRILAAARPAGQDGGLGHDVTLRQAIEAALPYVATSFKDQPLIEARLRSTLGMSFYYLGLPTLAIGQRELERSLLSDHFGDDHPHTLAAISELANAYRAAGRLEEALPLYEQSFAAMRQEMGPAHPDSLALMNNLAYAYHAAGRLDEALRLYEQTLAAMRQEMGADHPHTLASMGNLATAYHAAGRLDEALPLFEQTLAARRQKLGPDHPDTLGSMNDLANAYSAAGRLAEALPLYEQTLVAMRQTLGPDHPYMLNSMNNLANAYHTAGLPQEAIPLYEQTLAARRQKLGPDHPNTLRSMNNLAHGYRAAGRLDEAVALFEETLAARRQELGPDHPHTLNSMNSLTQAYIDTAAADADAGDLKSAIEWAENALEVLGEKGDAQLREQILRALEDYKAGRPLRENGAASNDVPSRDENGMASDNPKHSSLTAESDTADATSKK